jgi:hypothetical protein
MDITGWLALLTTLSHSHLQHLITPQTCHHSQPLQTKLLVPLLALLF